MTQNLPVVPQQNKPLFARMADKFGVEQDKLLTTLKATAFRVRDGVVTNEQMTALLIVADQYGLNPFTKELYAYPDKGGGIVPVVSVDGWARIINEHPNANGMAFEYSDKIVKPKGGKESPEWCKCILYRKDRAHPTQITEYLDEVFRELNYTNPWQTHTKRMLRHKALIQCARITFGFAGIYDQDEAERIIEMDVTPVTPKAGVMKALPIKRQEVIAETAAQIRGLMKNDQNADAYAIWQCSGFDTEENIALWSLLDSKERGILDRMGEAERSQNSGVISEAKRKRLEALIKEKGLNREAVKKYCKEEFGAEHFTELTNEAYGKLDIEISHGNPAFTPSGTAAAPSTPPAGDHPASTTTDAAAATINDDQEKALIDLITAAGMEIRDFTKHAKVAKLRDLKADRYEGAAKWLREKAAK